MVKQNDLNHPEKHLFKKPKKFNQQNLGLTFYLLFNAFIKTSFKHHNEFIHNEHSNLTESEGEYTTQTNNAQVNQKVKKHAKKKKSTNK